MQTSVHFNVNGEEFSCEGKTMKSPGFTAVMYWLAIQPDESLPHFQKGDTHEIKQVNTYTFICTVFRLLIDRSIDLLMIIMIQFIEFQMIQAGIP